MKRAPFLGASAAVILTGCGGSRVIRALPGVAPSSPKQPVSVGTFVPASADAIPDSVLSHPIVGEVRRFDGPAAPSGWVFAQGQAVDITQNRALFSVLGTAAGGDGKATFKLPKPPFSLIVAVAGMLPASPTTLARSGRDLAMASSLGPGAVPAPVRMRPPLSAAALADRRLSTSGIRARSSAPVRLTTEQIEQIRRANDDARTAAADRLSAGNRALLADAVQRFLAGRIALNDAIQEMAPSLTNGEADAILGIRAAMMRRFDQNASLSRTGDDRLEASRALFAVSISNEQIVAASARGVELR